MLLTPRPLTQPVSILKEFLVVLGVHLPLVAFYCSCQKTLPLCLNPLLAKSCGIADKVCHACLLLAQELLSIQKPGDV